LRKENPLWYLNNESHVVLTARHEFEIYCHDQVTALDAFDRTALRTTMSERKVHLHLSIVMFDVP